MILDATACILRPWRDDDLEPLVRLANNPRIACWLRDRFPHPYTREDGLAWLSTAATLPMGSNFAIVVEGGVAGGIGLHAGEDIMRIGAEVGYWLGEPFWGRGIATAALRTFTTNTFATFPFERLCAKAFTANVASCRVLDKAGYQRECVMRRVAIKNGVVHDMALYARLRGE